MLLEHSLLLEKKCSFLRDLSGVLAASDGISSTANLILDLALGYTRARKGSVMLASEYGDLHIAASRGLDINMATSYRGRLGEGIAGTIAEAGSPVLVEDIRMDGTFNGMTRGSYDSQSFISCPIMRQTKLLGLFNVSDKANNEPFTTDDLDLLRIIANHAALSFENALLMGRLEAKRTDWEERGRRLVNAYGPRTDFLSDVSHELRSPLNSINGSIYYLRSYEETKDGTSKDFFDIIADESARLSATVDRLLDYLWREDESKRIKRSMVDLPRLLEEAVNSPVLKDSLERKNITLRTELSGRISISGDRIKIFQFFVTMIGGLCHYLNENGSIRINLSEKDSVKVSIALSSGMPDILITNLFNWHQMFETDKSHAAAKLYRALKIARIHGWKFTTENSKDDFSLTITIPQGARQEVDAAVDKVMGKVVEFIAELLATDSCSIMLIDNVTGDLAIRKAFGLDDRTIKATRMKVGEGIAGWVALEGTPLLVQDIRTDHRFRRTSVVRYGTNSLMSVPLKLNGETAGVINVADKRTAGPFTARDLFILCTLSDRAASLLDRLCSGAYREHEIREMAASFDHLLASLKKYRKKGSAFPDLAVRIMNALGAAEEEKGLALYASMIYDLGLACLHEGLLAKKDLSPFEYSLIRVHPYNSVNLIDNFEWSGEVKEAILHHHEKYDGTGYPDRLKKEEIPLISRVLSVVDAFCAMITERPYRRAFTEDEALREIKREAGSRFDPSVVKALDKALQFA